jgi:hypothetical protein
MGGFAGRSSSIMSFDRREFLRMGAGACMLPAVMQRVRASAPPRLYRWWPRIPIAEELLVVPFAGDLEEGMLLESAAGLAAHAALHGSWRILVYEELENDGYKRWIAAYCLAHKPRVVRTHLDDVVKRLHDANLARGFILYRLDVSARSLHSDGPMDESVNVATSLAARLKGLVVSERLAERMERLGLAQLEDVRGKTEQWCLDTYGARFSRRLLGTADPKTRNVRSLMIALEAFCCSGRGEPYRRGLEHCEPDTPVLGWGCAAEDAETIPSSRYGLYQTATNWCHNLTVFGGESAPDSMSQALLRMRHSVRLRDLDWGDGRHYASLVLSDGDNVQWLMGNFTGGPEAPSYYANPSRGKIPFGWGVSGPSLAQLSPRTLAEILGRATPNDDFVFYSGGGYFYPDLYGKARESRQALDLHAERLRGYMDMTGVRVLAYNFQRWDSADAMEACRVFASHIPGLLGILAFQYYPYSAGEGAIHWVRGAGADEVPVVSCRLCIWAQTERSRDTTPAGVAAWLNRQRPVGPAASADCFSWVIAHAWSRFKHVEPGAPSEEEEQGVPQDRDAPGTARGYDPALWCAQRLNSTVKLVTPHELLWRIRLRLRPASTLSAWASELRSRIERGHEAGVLLARAEDLLRRAGSEPAGSRCFDLLKQVETALARSGRR